MVSEEVDRKGIMRDVRRIFIKLSSRLLFQMNEDGTLKLPLEFDKFFFDNLIREYCALSEYGIEDSVLISGGAELAGLREHGLDKSFYNGMNEYEALRKKQAFTTNGWDIVVGQYRKAFEKYGKKVGSVLVTSDDFKDYEHIRNIIKVHKTNKELGSETVYNNNDPTSTAELGGYSENDNLTADFAITYDQHEPIGGLTLVTFMSEHAFYNMNPRLNRGAELIPVIYCPISIEIMEMSDEGMYPKIRSADILGHHEKVSVITDGKYRQGHENIILPIIRGEPLGTIVLPSRYRKLS